MEEQFFLKYYGKYSIMEQNSMTAEERAWTINKLKDMMKESK